MKNLTRETHKSLIKPTWNQKFSMFLLIKIIITKKTYAKNSNRLCRYENQKALIYFPNYTNKQLTNEHQCHIHNFKNNYFNYFSRHVFSMFTDIHNMFTCQIYCYKWLGCLDWKTSVNFRQGKMATPFHLLSKITYYSGIFFYSIIMIICLLPYLQWLISTPF